MAEVARAIAESGFAVTEVVSGTARGVDRLGERWARERGIPVRRFPARWNELGRRAGYVRNLEMVEYGDALVAVWDGESRGTRHVISAATKAGRSVHVHLLGGDDGQG